MDGEITRITRDVNNKPLAIIAPHGQTTTFTLDSQGYLTSVTNPAQETYRLGFDQNGLLQTFIDPKQHQSTYRYNELGLLEEDTDAAGGGWQLARNKNTQGKGYTTTLTSKEGRVSIYQVKPQTNGDSLRVQIAPDGTQTQTLTTATGQTIQTAADGTTITSEVGPDPRFGMQAPLTKSWKVETPNGLKAEAKTERKVELLDKDKPLSLSKLTDTVTVNSKQATSVYEATTKKMTTTTPAGRSSTCYLNDKGRLLKVQVPQLAEVTYTYDDQGRLIQISQGSGAQARIITMTYNQAGEVEKITNPLQQEMKFDYDAVGRILAQTLTDGRIIEWDYDANGHVTRITPPGRPVHQFDYTVVDLPSEYSPPLLPAVSQPQTQYRWNLDKQFIQLIRPDGQTISFDYDATQGRLNQIILTEGTQTLTYDPQGRLASVTTVDGSQLSYSYDGSLVLSETWTGSIQGSLQRTYNNDFQVSAMSVNNENNVNYQYDKDGLLIKAGDLAFTRDAQNGLLTGTQLGKLTTQVSNNPFGELQEETTRFNNNLLYQTRYDRDPAGRIIQKTETVEGVTHTFNYSYDLANRLAEVKQDGVVTHTYQYDANGNRLNHQAVYDDQDRLLQNGSNTYTYTANGELLTKNDLHYHYDVLGNLRQVQGPDKTIDYIIDASNRRVGKKVNGQLVQGFLWESQLRIAAELDATGNVVSHFIYGTKVNVPDLFIKSGTTYRVITDHLGSPRLIINTSTGEVAQRLDYDTWGNVLYDSNPGFQPFGFAGGLYDGDTGLVRFGARDYDSEVGRWTSKEPLGFAGGMNFYAYAVDSPLNFIDDNGLLIKLNGKTANDAYNKMKSNLPGKTLDLLKALEADPTIMIHVFESYAPDTRGGRTYQYQDPKYRGICSSKHPGGKFNKMKDWDVNLDPKRAANYEGDTGIPQPMDAILYHEIFGHVVREIFGGRRSTERGATERENQYRDWRKLPHALIGPDWE